MPNRASDKRGTKIDIATEHALHAHVTTAHAHVTTNDDRCVTTKVMLRYHTRCCIPPWSCAWWHRESRDTYGTLGFA